MKLFLNPHHISIFSSVSFGLTYSDTLFGTLSAGTIDNITLNSKQYEWDKKEGAVRSSYFFGIQTYLIIYNGFLSQSYGQDM